MKHFSCSSDFVPVRWEAPLPEKRSPGKQAEVSLRKEKNDTLRWELASSGGGAPRSATAACQFVGVNSWRRRRNVIRGHYALQTIYLEFI